MVEAVPAAATSGVATASCRHNCWSDNGSEGSLLRCSRIQVVMFSSGGNPTTLSKLSMLVIQRRLDKQGAIEENVIFVVDRQFSFDIDDMLAAQNSYGAGGTSYGLFDNDADMALNLGFHRIP